MGIIIREITAKQLLTTYKQEDTYFGIKYAMNIYRGCSHQCIYCDSRSECYQIENFSDTLVKVNAVELLRKELARKKSIGTIGTGSMNDPYAPIEAKYLLVRSALKVIAENGFPVHVITKSGLVIRDADILEQITKVYAAVSITITTYEDELAAKLEPGAPSVTKRLEAIRLLSGKGIYTGITMMPVLPFIEDNETNIIEIVKRAVDSGARYILPAFGVTLRDRQRAYYYKKLDGLFPGLKEKYQTSYGAMYQCWSDNSEKLGQILEEACSKYGITTMMNKFNDSRQVEQMSIFDDKL